ncbi:MAG: hypothetical protein QOH62_130 [Solirubrobacteraceae bacterium]|jgi:uncharacterized protein (DUF1015 family)|nr:hypothetical protein [Solirubrobacteraceae bacterium]
MADVQPLEALHYDQAVAGPLQQLVAPPYDVIDPEQRAQLAARSPHNVVRVDLPEGDDPYATAAEIFRGWQDEHAVVRDDTPAFWAVVQDYTGPDGRRLTRRGIFARVRVTEYGPGKIRPHERTHPGPKEDRLNLTRATQANLSPIFSLYDDPDQQAWAALEPFTRNDPWGEATDDDGTVNRLWRIDDAAAIETVRGALAPTELLIADGHHRYETARVYADEIGGEGDHRYVLMCLVALQDEGLTVFPTHRLLTDVKDSEKQMRLGARLRELFDIEPIEQSELRPPDGSGPLQMGYIDAFHKQAYRLTLSDQSIADEALRDFPEPYRHLDTAILEALVIKGPAGLTDDDIDHKHGLDYSRTDEEALEMVLDGRADCAFFLRSSPVQQVRDIAAAGVNMPPKSTYFFPKVPTGLLFNPLG